MEYINEILSVLYDEGIQVEYEGNDLDLREYIVESIQFISFIVDLENRFSIEIPDEVLRYELISSLHALSCFIGRLKEDNS